MKIVLLGYMASGKSSVGRLLANVLNYSYIDLDHYIEEQEESTVQTIFDSKGEIYFRKQELHYLKEVLSNRDNMVLSLGGGTPCFGQNMNFIKQAANAHSIYLKLSPENLALRILEDPQPRPLVDHLKEKEKLIEFIQKHLFERNFYYNQATSKLEVGEKSLQEIVEEIVLKLL
ncbi:MAG: shikimate kinase [bacterium]